ncbi:hypothetical protein [Micromonospora sp. NPDC005367]|uniref:hypothetical protein n=1 Tax=Micromonospora sp. NPDC005367 TaxID=3155590 RepID=UPI0033AE1830
MTMQDNDVRAILRRATDHLAGPPGFLDEVRRGGRRRVVRRRAVLATAVAVLVVAPVVGALEFSGARDRGEVASPLLAQPTHGDLAGDTGYLRQVVETWRRHLEENALDEGLRGEPHVVWAGRTPVGPAAYVAQGTAADRVVSEPQGDRMVAVAAFVEPTADGPRVMTGETVTDAGTHGNSQAALLGPERNVLLVLDAGAPVEFSPELRYTADGRIDRTFEPVAFRDGAAVLQVPPQRTKITVALARTPVSMANQVHITNATDILQPNGGDLPPQPILSHTLPGAEAVWGDKDVPEVPALDAYYDAGGVHTHDGSPLLYIRGATPDGRRLLLQTIQYDDDPPRVIVMLARGDAPFTVAAGGFADRKAPLPVRLRLPDQQGVLVAAEGAALDYRIGAGKWHDAGRDAALLPANATEVRVTPATGNATTITTAP